MALYTPPRIPLNVTPRATANYRDSWLPVVGACVVAVVIMAIVFPHSFGIMGINPRSAPTVPGQLSFENSGVTPGSTASPQATRTPVE